MKGPINERLIGKPLHNLPKQPPSVDGGISPINGGACILDLAIHYCAHSIVSIVFPSF